MEQRLKSLYYIKKPKHTQYIHYQGIPKITVPVCEQYSGVLKHSSCCIKRHAWSCTSQQMSLFTIPTVDKKIFCVNLCLYGIIRCIHPWKDKHGQGQRKIFFRIAFKQAEELGLIYECISTIHLKICNVCAAWQEKKVRVM